MANESFNVGDGDSELREDAPVKADGTSDVPVRFDFTVTKMDSDGRRILTDSLDTGEKLLRNKVYTAAEIAESAVQAPTQQTASAPEAEEPKAEEAAPPKTRARKSTATPAADPETPPAGDSNEPN